MRGTMRRLVGTAIALALSTPVVFARVVRLPAIIEKLPAYLENPYLQYIFITLSLWTMAFCIFQFGMIKAGILTKDSNSLNKQGKILAGTLASFLPLMFIFVTTNKDIKDVVLIAVRPAAYILGWAVAVVLPPMLYYAVNRLPMFTDESSASPAPPPTPTPPRSP